MVAHLDHFVRGQDRAKRDLAVAVNNQYKARALRERDGEDLDRHQLPMIGPTSVWKSYLVKPFGDFRGVPVGFTRATSLVEIGYKGSSVESVVLALLVCAGGDARKREKASSFWAKSTYSTAAKLLRSGRQMEEDNSNKTELIRAAHDYLFLFPLTP